MTAGSRPDGVTGTLLADRRGPRFDAWVGCPTAAPWVPAARLFGADLPGALRAVAETRGASHLAVAGALLVEQYAQRVVPPVVAAVLTEGRAPAVDLTAVRVAWSEARIVGVALAGPVATAGPDALDALLDRNLAPVVDTVHRTAGTGRRVLRGALAHAVTVTALHLSWPDDDPARYLEHTRRLLAAWRLADLVTVEDVEVDRERWLYAERRSCCLAFRTTDHRTRADPYCATCPVVPEADRRRSFHEAVADFRRRTRRAPVRDTT